MTDDIWDGAYSAGIAGDKPDMGKILAIYDEGIGKIRSDLSSYLSKDPSWKHALRRLSDYKGNRPSYIEVAGTMRELDGLLKVPNQSMDNISKIERLHSDLSECLTLALYGERMSEK